MEREINRRDAEQLLREAGCGDRFVRDFLTVMDEGSRRPSFACSGSRDAASFNSGSPTRADDPLVL